MKNTSLIRYNHRKPDHRTLQEMRDYLENLIDGNMGKTEGTEKIEENESDKRKILEEIMAFQYEDGSFNLLDSYRIESDCRVVYCHEPTYICTAILMKALLDDEHALGGREWDILPAAMHMCCARGLQGHGYEALKGLIQSVNYFIRSDVKRFLKRYPDICPEFTEMFGRIEKHFAELVKNGEFQGPWGDDYEQQIRAIHDYFHNHIFVYGTLMTGQPNHDAFLKGSCKIADGWITGYEMYDLGSFPGIKEGEGQVFGEVYSVTDEELEQIDWLEGEGSLYLRIPVTVNTDDERSIQAAAYEYNGSVAGCSRLACRYGQEEYVWYASYGSNLLEERLGYYIQGGLCKENGKTYYPCFDTSMPEDSRPITIPYDMYYSNYAEGSWKRSAVSFLDLSKPGFSYGRAYKIKRSQFKEIHDKEGRGSKWYPECIFLGYIDGIPVYTYAGHQNKPRESFDRVSSEYGIVLYRGMKETYPEMSDDAIMEYLRGCGKV